MTSASSSPEPILSIDGLTKTFGPVTAVDRVSLDIRRNEFFALLGPSGCGKTTLLRMLAGFEAPSGGRILLDGKDISGLPPERRPLNLMFQSYALFPHMTVAKNLAYGLEMDRLPKAEIARRVEEIMAVTDLAGFADRKPDQLSGGQKQRVALARALVKRPKVLLLDEPLGALDKKLRERMQLELKRLQHDVGITFIIVTHDQEEALSISDRIVVMNAGKADQIGTPFEIYNRPTTRFVASFVGTLNVLDAVVADQAAGLVRIGDQTVAIKEAIPAANGATIQLAMRPEAGTLAATEGSTVKGQVTSSQFLGSVIRTRIDLGGKTLSFDTFNDPSATPPTVGSTIGVKIDPTGLILLAD